MRLFVDSAPLRRSPPFRWLWGSSVVGGVAGQVGVFAVTFQVFTLTGSSLAVAGIGVCVALPTIAFTMIGGSLADRVDRRMLLLLGSTTQLLIGLGFVAQAALGGGSLPLIYGLVALQATVGALAGPARRAILRRILPAADMTGGIALMLLAMQVAQVAGPLLGGGIAGAASVTWCFAAQVVGSAVAVVAAVRLPGIPAEPIPAEPAPAPAAGVSPRGVREALRFVLASPVLRGALLADLALTVLAAPTALFPQLNAERFGGSAETLGYLSAAVALGGVLGTLLSGPWARVARPGRALLLVSLGWALTIGALAVTGELWLALVVLTVMGAADAAALTVGQSLVQAVTPDRIRGRVSAAEQIVQMGGPQLGGLRAGGVGALWGSAVGLAAGAAVAVIALVVVAASNRPLWAYREVLR